MRKRKTATLNAAAAEGKERGDDGGDGDGDVVGDGGKGFFACYLLASLSPRHKGHTYIGFTVNPRRRIRQHNGEIGSGAWRTKSRRPWEMVLCIYGFPTNVAALQFEWAWQHPTESLAVRKAAVTNFKSFSGISNKIKLAYTMLTLHTWQSMNLTVNFFSTKYMKHAAGCPSLPKQIKVHICSMDDLPCYSGVDYDDQQHDWDYDLDPDEQPQPDQETSPIMDNNESGGVAIADPPHHLTSPVSDDSTALRQTDPCLGSHDYYCTTPTSTGEKFCSQNDEDGVRTTTADPLVSLLLPSPQQSPTSGTRDGSGRINQQPWFQREVEVIDLSTPSTFRRTKPFSRKKSKSTTLSTEIIDLTASPIFAPCTTS